MPGYAPTVADVEKVVGWFETRRFPAAVIVPPRTDAHLAHRVTPGPLAAIGLVGSPPEKTVRSSPRGPRGNLFPQPNACLTYDGESRRHQGVGDPLPRLAGFLDGLHPVLLAPGTGLCGARA